MNVFFEFFEKNISIFKLNKINTTYDTFTWN